MFIKHNVSNEQPLHKGERVCVFHYWPWNTEPLKCVIPCLPVMKSHLPLIYQRALLYLLLHADTGLCLYSLFPSLSVASLSGWSVQESLLYKFSLSVVTHVHTHVILSVWRPLKEKSLMFVIITWRVGVWPRPAVPHQTLHFICQDERFKENWAQTPSHGASEPFYSSRAYIVMKYLMELMTHFTIIETIPPYFCEKKTGI